jgi:hypothetical protein
MSEPAENQSYSAVDAKIGAGCVEAFVAINRTLPSGHELLLAIGGVLPSDG